MASLLRRIAVSYSGAALKKPWTVGFGTCFVKGCFCDLVAQTVVENALELEGGIDWRRMLGFSLFSGAYTGLFQRVLYVHFYTRLFGSAETVQVALKKTIFDATVHTPFSYLPACYIASNAFCGKDPLAGLYKYMEWDEWTSINMKCACLWLPVHFITFKVCPVHLRVAWPASVSACWLVALSTFAHFKQDDTFNTATLPDRIQDTKAESTVVEWLPIPARSH